MSQNARKWLVRLLDFLSVALPLLIGICYIAVSILFRDFWGVPDTAAETKEADVMLLIGGALVVAALMLPLKSKKRFLISFGVVTVAMWYGILPGGQQDQFFLFVLYALIAPILYLTKKKIKSLG